MITLKEQGKALSSVANAQCYEDVWSDCICKFACLFTCTTWFTDLLFYPHPLTRLLLTARLPVALNAQLICSFGS